MHQDDPRKTALKNELKQINNKVSEKESRKTTKYSKLIEELGIQR